MSQNHRVPRSTGVTLPPFQALYDEHRDRVWRFVVSLVGRADADDVFQETWLAALRSYPTLRDASNLRSWVLTIAASKATDEHRSRARRPAPVDAVPDIASAAATTHDDGLWAQVRELPPKQRTALAHRFVGDLAYDDIAAVMGTSPAAARRNVHEALTKLRSTCFAPQAPR